MLYEAYKELRDKRHEKIRQAGIQEGVQQERERRLGQEKVPPDNPQKDDKNEESTQKP